jgi:hypothetical protein
MPKPIEKILLFLSDFVTINASFFFWILLRQRFGFASPLSFSDYAVVSAIVFLFWLLILH